LAAHDRQHHGARPLSGSGRKRGTHKEGFGQSRGGFTSKIHARANVVQILEGICRQLGYPKTIRMDKAASSPPATSWAYANGVTLDFSRPGKPTDNGFIEAFKSKFRQECPNTHWFLALADALEKLETWRREYNEVRSHSAIGYNVPIALQNPVAVPARHRDQSTQTLPTGAPENGPSATEERTLLSSG
jgi:putative transposase